MNIYSKLNDYIRINFIGRPLELNKLVYDEGVILENHEEADKVIRGYRLYYGWQYFGNFIAFSNLILIIKLKANKNLNNFMLFMLTPMLGCYIYSHFTYWDIVRQVVIDTRKREKDLTQKPQEEVRIKLNTSIDLHIHIQRNIKITQCLIEILK
jgi:hypothetical protein